MRLTEAQISHLAHRAIDAIRAAGVRVVNERVALGEAKELLARALGEDAGTHERVVRKIASLSRRVPEGSSEYEILYRQYFEEESRRGRR